MHATHAETQSRCCSNDLCGHRLNRAERRYISDMHTNLSILGVLLLLSLGGCAWSLAKTQAPTSAKIGLAALDLTLVFWWCVPWSLDLGVYMSTMSLALAAVFLLGLPALHLLLLKHLAPRSLVLLFLSLIAVELSVIAWQLPTLATAMASDHFFDASTP